MQPTVTIPRAQLEQMIVRLERIEWALLQYQRAFTAMMGEAHGEQAATRQAPQDGAAAQVRPPQADSGRSDG